MPEKVELVVKDTELRKSKEVVRRSREGTGEMMIYSSDDHLCEYCCCTCVSNTTECSSCETGRCMCVAGSPFDGCSVSTFTRVRACHAILSERLM